MRTRRAAGDALVDGIRIAGHLVAAAVARARDARDLRHEHDVEARARAGGDRDLAQPVPSTIPSSFPAATMLGVTSPGTASSTAVSTGSATVPPPLSVTVK